MNKKTAFLRGALAGAAALVILWVLGTFFPRITYPPARVAAILISLAPGDFATFVIERMGKAGLRTLSVAVNLGSALAGGFASIWVLRAKDLRGLTARRVAIGVAIVLFSTVLAIFGPEGFSLTALLGYGFAALAYAHFIRPEVPRVQPGDTPLDTIRKDRRRFLTRAAAAVAGVLIGGVMTARYLRRKSSMDVRIAAADVPWTSPPDDPGFPRVPGLTEEITSNEAFYNVDINLVKPAVDHERWSLRIKGMVAKPYELSYRQLQEQFEVVELAHTLTCISNEIGGDLISTAVWRGVRLRDVLERAGLNDDAVDIIFRAADGYSDSITKQKALEDTTLVVFGMNGKPLARDHGFPARIIVPGIYGMKNVKWLESIEASPTDYKGYWMVRGWSDEAVIKTQSRIDVPKSGARSAATAAGIAWAGDRGLERVEISVDGGRTWQAAVMKRELSRVAWRLWAAELPAGRRGRKLIVRATDGNGEIQSATVTKPHPDGASGYHSVGG